MSSSGVLGTLVIRIAAEIRKYQADLNTAAKDTEEAAKKIEKSSELASQAASRMGGGMEEAVRAGMALHGAAGVAGLSVGLLAVGLGGAAFAAIQGAKEQKAYEKSLILSGNAAGVTAGQLADMAAGIDRVVGTQAQAAAALAQMAGTGEVAAGNLQKFSQAAIEMERATDQSVGDTVKQFAELGREPVKASIKLNESLNYLTASTFEQIKAAQDLGDKERAADIAQNAYADAMKSRAAQIEQSAGYIEKAWRGVRDVAKEAWDSMLGLGRNETAGEKLSSMNKQLEGLKKTLAYYENRLAESDGGANTPALLIKIEATKKAIESYQGQAAALGGVAHAASEAARAQAEKAAQDKAGIKWIQDGNQYLDRAAKLNQKIIELTVEGVKAGASQEEIDRRIGIEREKAAEKGAKLAKAALTDAERMAAAGEKLAASLLAQEQGLSGDFAQKWDQLGAAYQAGAISLEVLVQAQARLLAQQPGIKAATEAIDKANLGAAQAHEKYVDSLTKGLAKIEEEIAQQKLHNEQIGLGKDAVADLTAARLEDQAAMLEGQAIKQMDKNLDLVQYELLMSQARALRELAALKREGGAAQVAVDAAKEATRAWDKFADQVNQSLSDALMNGFTAGKGFAQSFVDSVKAMFNTMVLRPVISAIVTGATGSLGLTGTANAATGGLGNVGSLASLAGVGGSFGAGIGAGFGSLIGEAGIMGGLDAGLIAMQAGNIAGGLGTLAGVLGPIALGIGAVYMLAKNLDHSGTPHTGGGSQYSAAGGLLDARSSVFASGFSGIAYSDSATQMTAGLVQSIVAILDSTATAFGQKAGYTAAASFADDSSKDGAWGSLRIADALGRVLTDWQAGGQSFRTFSDGSAGSAEYLAAISADVKQALDRIDLPAWARKTLDALGDAPSLEQMAAAVQQITAVQNAIAGQRAGLQQQLDLLTGVTTQREIERNALDESNRALYDQITALQDQKAATEAAAEAARAVASERAGLQQQLDLLTGATTQREIERNALNESNRALYDQIKALEDSKAAVEAQAVRVQALAEAERALAAERAGLMDQLWQATNRTADIRAKQLAGLDPANRPIQQALYDIADAQAAFGTLQSAVQAEKDRLTKKLADDKAALQQAAQADTGYLKDALDAQKATIGAELKLKQQGYADQISAAEEARSEMADIAGALAGAMKAVKVESDSYDLFRLQSARGLIAGAAASGNIKAAGLSDALGVAAQDSKRFYSTFEDYAFEQARTAGDIAKLNDAAQGQLSGFDQTIAALQASDALAQTLADAQLAALEAQYQQDVSAAQLAAQIASEGIAAQLAALDAQYQLDVAALDKTVADAQDQLNALLGIDSSIKTVGQAVDAFGAAVLAAVHSVDAARVTDAAAQAAGAIGAAMASSAAAVAATGVARTVTGPPPVKAGMYGFAVGTNYVPYDMVAQLHQGEAVVPRAYNPAAGGNAQVNAELVAEVRALRAELAAQNRAIAENTRDTAKIMRRWHGDGMPETRTVT